MKFHIGQRVKRARWALDITHGGIKHGEVTAFAKTGHRPKVYVLIDGNKHSLAYPQHYWERE